VETTMAGTEDVKVLLPILEVDTQRERASIVKDIEDMVRKEVEKNIQLNNVELVNILFGIHTNEGKNAYFR
jgi:hypothetical protein